MKFMCAHRSEVSDLSSVRAFQDIFRVFIYDLFITVGVGSGAVV